jgi:hypothetical protein
VQFELPSASKSLIAYELPPVEEVSEFEFVGQGAIAAFIRRFNTRVN